MANTKIPIELSSTPSIVDNGDAAAITIDSSEKSTFSGDVEVGTTAPKINLKNTDTSIVADQSLGVIEVESSDGSTGSAGTIAKLDIAASGTFDGSGHGSDFRFITGATNQSGSISLSEKLRIQTTGGISFNGDTATANALDDYEEGTFSGTTDGSAYSGTYTKIGRICHVSFESDNSSSTGVSIAVMPFSAKAGTPVNGSQPTFNTSNTNDNVYVAIYNGGSTAYIYSRTGTTQPVTTGIINVNFVYETD